MKRVLLSGALAVAALLATAQAAGAKGFINAIRVCGPSGCATATAPRAVMQGFAMDLLGGPPAIVGPPRLGPYYQLAFRPVGEIPNVDTFYVPGAAMVCTGRGCFALSTRLVPALETAAAQVTAYRPVISSVTVDGRTRSHPAAYAALYSGKPAPAPPSPIWKTRGHSIEFEFSRTTPWSLGWMSGMTYYPRYRVVTRAGTWSHVSAALDRRIRTHPAEARASTGGGHPWWPVAAAALVAIAAAAGAGTRLRRPRAA
jgi:hypothetical protein